MNLAKTLIISLNKNARISDGIIKYDIDQIVDDVLAMNRPAVNSALKYKGYIVKPASPTGGKAGRGYNKTSTIQIIENMCVIKAFRFKMNDFNSRAQAVQKAKSFIDEQI